MEEKKVFAQKSLDRKKNDKKEEGHAPYQLRVAYNSQAGRSLFRRIKHSTISKSFSKGSLTFSPIFQLLTLFLLFSHKLT